MNKLNAEIKSWSTQKLREACNELMSWKSTGLLKQDGVLIELRDFVTNNRWIGNTGMSSYIVELIEKTPKKAINICDECGSLMDGFICLNC